MRTFHWASEALDAATAEESLRAISPNAELGRNPDPRHRLRVDGDPRFSMLRFELAGQLVGANTPDDTIIIPYAVSGLMQWEVGEERGTANLPWLQGTTKRTFSTWGPREERPVSSAFGPAVQYATFLQKPPLLALGRALYGDDGFALRFDGSVARSTAHARTLAATLDLAFQMAASKAFEQSLVRTSLYRLLAVTVFDTFRLGGDHRARTLTAEGRQARYRIASQFIADHASLPITPEDIAAAADVGLRELDGLFRAFSPFAHGVADQLRATRLAAAHDDLTRADPTRGDTVREIAHRWGFASPSRFAAHYRQAYGRNPKWVLDR